MKYAPKLDRSQWPALNDLDDWRQSPSGEVRVWYVQDAARRLEYRVCKGIDGDIETVTVHHAPPPDTGADEDDAEMPLYLQEFAGAMARLGREAQPDEFARCMAVLESRIDDSAARSDSLWLNPFEVPVLQEALRQVRGLWEENKRLRAALEWYADEENLDGAGEGRHMRGGGLPDCGHTARAALATEAQA